MLEKIFDFLVVFIIGLIIPTVIFTVKIRNIESDHQFEIQELNSKIIELEISNHKKLAKNYLFLDIIRGYQLSNYWEVEVSAYTARPQETNWDFKNTSIMEEPVPGWTMAVSQDLRFLLGKRVYVPGYGVRYVNDLMNIRYEKTIDILVGTVGQAREIGRHEGELILIEPYNFAGVMHDYTRKNVK